MRKFIFYLIFLRFGEIFLEILYFKEFKLFFFREIPNIVLRAKELVLDFENLIFF